jgi:hypothetical protein
LRRKGSKKKQSYQVDEHDMPTEPIPAILFPTPDLEQPPPAYPYIQTPTSGMGSAYPVFPGTPSRTSYGGWPTNAAWSYRNTKREDTRRRRFLPACVGLFFLCVQLLLIARLGVRFLGLSPDITWVAFVTAMSDTFVFPFRLLWVQIPLVSTLLPVNMEVYTFVAILAYRVLSRLLVGILKVILKSR